MALLTDDAAPPRPLYSARPLSSKVHIMAMASSQMTELFSYMVILLRLLGVQRKGGIPNVLKSFFSLHQGFPSAYDKRR